MTTNAGRAVMKRLDTLLVSVHGDVLTFRTPPGESLLENAVAAIEGESTRPWREALSELLLGGAHDGPCDNASGEACDLHIEAYRRREFAARSLLEALP